MLEQGIGNKFNGFLTPGLSKIVPVEATHGANAFQDFIGGLKKFASDVQHLAGNRGGPGSSPTPS